MHLERKAPFQQLPEEYTRVTNPERFRGLHAFAVEFLAQLRNDYDVIESEVFELIPGIMRPVEYARPPVTLTPRLGDAAPISIAFTSFPSLIVRCGRFFNAPLPACACDACDASAEGETVRLQRTLANVVSGHFREDIELPFFGTARVRWLLGTMGGANGMSAGGNPISRDRARSLRRAGLKSVEWKPWPRRR